MDDQIPGIAVVLCAGSDNLGAVDGASSADGQHHIDAVFLAERHASSDGLNLRVRLDTGKLLDCQACFLQNLHGSIIDAIPLDASAAIHEQNLAAAFLQLAQVRNLSLPEMNPGGHLKCEIVHIYLLYMKDFHQNSLLL